MKDPLARAHPLDCECPRCVSANNWARNKARYNQCTGTTVTGRRCHAKVYAPAKRCFNHYYEEEAS